MARMADPFRWNRRRGFWRFHHTFIEDCRSALMLIQRDTLILRIEYDIETDRTQYFGQASHFDIVPEGCRTPEYALHFWSERRWPLTPVKVSWRRKLSPDEETVTWGWGQDNLPEGAWTAGALEPAIA